MKCEKCKKLRDRVDELEAMVAMAQPPSSEFWPIGVCLRWCEDQRKIKQKLDKIAGRERRV